MVGGIVMSHIMKQIVSICAFNAFLNASLLKKTHLERIKNALKQINFYNTWLHIPVLPIAIFLQTSFYPK